MDKALGSLVEVDLREMWESESSHFTRWLVEDENLARLSEELGMDLELEGTEVPVGPYKADIVAKDISSNSRVVIENQLEKTDHKHLGQIITYASGLNAKTLVWVAKEFSEEHRRALDFLNENMGEGLRFFGLEIKLWQIDKSRPALKFNAVSWPNDYTALARVDEKDLSATKVVYLEFWNALKDYMTASKSFLPLRKARPQHWFSISVGRSKFNISLTASGQKKRIGCEIYLRGSGAKKAFVLLQKEKETIESITGPLDWQLLEDGQDCRIVLFRNGIDIMDKKTWGDAHKWLKEKSEIFHKAFSSKIKSLDLAE